MNKENPDSILGKGRRVSSLLDEIKQEVKDKENPLTSEVEQLFKARKQGKIEELIKLDVSDDVTPSIS